MYETLNSDFERQKVKQAQADKEVDEQNKLITNLKSTCLDL